MRVFDFLAQADTTLTLVIPVNHEADSVEQIRILADGLKNRCRYVVVKNQAHSEHFRLYERSESRARLLNELGGREFIMPRMYYWIVAALNEHDLTTTAAMSHLAITLFDRCRIANWQRQFYEQADQMRDLLLPDGARVYHSGFAGK